MPPSAPALLLHNVVDAAADLSSTAAFLVSLEQHREGNGAAQSWIRSMIALRDR